MAIYALTATVVLRILTWYVQVSDSLTAGIFAQQQQTLYVFFLYLCVESCLMFMHEQLCSVSSESCKVFVIGSLNCFHNCFNLVWSFDLHLPQQLLHSFY